MTTTADAPAPVTEKPAAPAQPAAPAPAAPAEPDLAARLRAAEAERDDWKSQARKHEGRDKEKRTQLEAQTALLRTLAEKAGVPFDSTPDPAALTARLDAANATAKQRAVELAVFRSAAPAGADASALLDSRQFMDKAAALDPDAADFGDQLAALVTEAAGQARYKAPAATVPVGDGQPTATVPAAASGADFSGAPQGSRMWGQADYDRAVAAGDLDGITKAINAGLLVNLGIGKPKGNRR